MNNLENNGKVKNVVINVLIILLIIALGFICYDSFLTKDNSIKQNCRCPKCENCNTEIEKIEPEEKICEIDMKDKNDLDVYTLCEDQEVSSTSNVKIKNIFINGKKYVLFHEFTPFYDSKGNYVNFNGITKLYLNGFLLDVYKGQNRQTLWRVKVDDTKLIISETWPSETPPADYTYDLKDFNYTGYTYDFKNLM